MGGKRSSAGRNRTFTHSVSRANIDGRLRGRERRSRSGTFGALFQRLRRLELVMLYFAGKKTIPDAVFEALLTTIADSERITEPDARRSDNERDSALLPLEGAPTGEVEGEAGADRPPDAEYEQPKKKGLFRPHAKSSEKA